MVRVLHAADLHVDSPQRGLVRYPHAPANLITTATRRATENLVDLAIAQPVDAVVLAGDVYDGDWRGFETGLFFQHQMQRLHDAGIRVFLVNGNHDADSQISRNLTLPPNVHRFTTHEPETVVDHDLGLAVHGQGYATRAVRENLVERFPAYIPSLYNIGLLHTSLSGRPPHAPYAPCTKEQLAAFGYDYWALGHVHTHEVVNHDPLILFPGNTQGRHALEEGPKGATVVTFSETGVDYQHHDLDVVRWAHVRVDAGGAESLETVLDLVRTQLREQRDQAGGRTLAARVSVTGRSDAHGELWRNSEQLDHEVRSCGQALSTVWVEKVRIATQPAEAYPGRNLTEDHEQIIGELARTAQQLGADGHRLRKLLESEPLWSILPGEVRTDDAIGAGDEHWRERLLGEASDLLFSMITEAAS